jgi:hypothetical protein
VIEDGEQGAGRWHGLGKFALSMGNNGMASEETARFAGKHQALGELVYLYA